MEYKFKQNLALIIFFSSLHTKLIFQEMSVQYSIEVLQHKSTIYGFQVVVRVNLTAQPYYAKVYIYMFHTT